MLSLSMDSHAGTDCLSVKRRFIRQNREIAKVNSTQSLRIRNLEIEISNLLSENITLREQAINATQEAEKWRSAYQLGTEVRAMKDKLESKLQEVSALVQELGNLPDQAARTRSSSGRCRSGIFEQVKNSDEREWTNRQTIGGAQAGDRDLPEGRLPVILEDKYYPRRTLETAEVRSLLDDAALQTSESPDLGPPPVAHFDVPDPISFDAGRCPVREGVADASGEDVLPLRVHLETRRKRRTSSLLQDMSTDQVPDEKPFDDPPPLPAKPGVKRKLDVSDLEEAVSRPAPENDDFFFQPKLAASSTALSSKKSSRFARAHRRDTDVAIEPTPPSPQNSLAPTTRKVLAPKSTNSPVKRKVHVNEKFVTARDDGSGSKPGGTRPARCQVGITASNLATPLDQAHPHDINLNGPEENNAMPPQTPAALDDVLSPLSTEPSITAEQRPKEAAMLNSVEDVLSGSIGRGSRRARAAISYAEPNLRDKLRRPGKEFVGAVEGIERARMVHADRDREREKSTEANGVRLVKIKQEKGTRGEVKWKELPMANVDSKQEELTSPLRDKEVRSTTEVALHRPKTAAERVGENEDANELDKAVERLSIFDPPVSSPVEPEGKHNMDTTTTAAAKRKATAATRRHSMQQLGTSSSTEMSASIPTRNEAKDTPGLGPDTTSVSVPRLRSAGSDTAQMELKRSNSTSTSNPSSRGNSSSRAVKTESGPGPGISRRRSMMV